MAIRTIYKLNDLDFTSGVRAQYINENFDLVRRWIEAERLRVGGWGLVEGFDLTENLENFTISVSEGTLINDKGEEVKVDSHIFNVGPPVYKNMVEDLTVDQEGLITLQFAPYSNRDKHTIIYDPPEHSTIHNDELYIVNLDTGANVTINEIRFIDENYIIVSSKLAGARVRVTYLYANDRIDGILLKNDGSEYIYELGIISTSPSQQVIQDYFDKGYYLIGFAYWHIGKEIAVEFITLDRTFRPVYVDEDNRLYLNGKLYTGDNFIYFEEPEYPEENDLWYDVEHEILYIWRPNPDTGEYEWRPVNDLSRFKREYEMFLPEENPDDLQTFTFENKQNLRFQPGHNQLTICIDQVTIMRDQYDELYPENNFDVDPCSGYGFKLKCPLDRPSVVEVTVDRSAAKLEHSTDLFPHIAAFIDTDSWTVNQEYPVNSIWECNGSYEIGNHQLEVWLNGTRLNRLEGFEEIKADGSDSSLEDYGTLSTKFKLLVPLGLNDNVSYKITRAMATYDNLRAVTDGLNQRVEEAVQELENAQNNLDNIVGNLDTTITDLTERTQSLLNDVEDLKVNKIGRDEGISLANLSTDIRAMLIKNAQYFSQNANVSSINLREIKETDYTNIHWILDDNTRIVLIRNLDYTVTPIENGVTITLDPKWLSDSAQIYIEVLSLGA